MSDGLIPDIVASITPRVYGTLLPREKIELREQYAFHQGDRCCFCGGYFCNPPIAGVADIPIDKWRFPPGFFDSYMHLHHDHDTGLTLGAVHAQCNAVLWQYLGR